MCTCVCARTVQDFNTNTVLSLDFFYCITQWKEGSPLSLQFLRGRNISESRIFDLCPCPATKLPCTGPIPFKCQLRSTTGLTGWFGGTPTWIRKPLCGCPPSRIGTFIHSQQTHTHIHIYIYYIMYIYIWVNYNISLTWIKFIIPSEVAVRSL